MLIVSNTKTILALVKSVKTFNKSKICFDIQEFSLIFLCDCNIFRPQNYFYSKKT
jgi:hypothetical protein